MAHHTPKQVVWGPEVVLLTLIALTALAQDEPRGFNAHGFTLVAHDADTRDGLVLQRPGDIEQGTFFAGGVLSYAKSPLVLEDAITGDQEVVLDHVLAANVSLGGAVHDRLRFDVLMPLYLTSTGPAGGQGVGFGDLRLSALGAALRPSDNNGWGLAAVPWLDLPTGVQSEYLGQRAVGGGFVVAATREVERVTVTANSGARFNPRTEERNLENADVFIAGLGGGYLVRPDTGVGLEIRGDVPLSRAGVEGTGSPWEAIANVRHVRENGGFISGGFATALSSGAGAALFRIFVGGGFGGKAELGPRDRDLDGIVNRDDACPDVPETLNDYQDTDGCPDALPQLTVQPMLGDAGVAGADVTVSADGELVFDAVADTPPTVEVRPGAVSVEARKGACLAGSATADVTGDQALVVPMEAVKDALLQIVVKDPAEQPITAATIKLTPSEEGCQSDPVTLDAAGSGTTYVGPATWSIDVEAPGFHPFNTGVMMVAGGDEQVVAVLTPIQKLEKVRVEETGIVLLEQVFFDSGRATLRKGSSDVLDEVVLALNGLPRKGTVEIQGHTDNVGGEETNRKLSQSRAETVMKYLVDNGIPADRLNAKGYGESQPTTTNRTPKGRQANRRVEFVFVKE